MKKEKPERIVDNIKFDSQEEIDFYFWLKVAAYHGIISHWDYHPRSFELAPKQTYQVEVKNRNGFKTVERHLLNNCEYTPDFFIIPGNKWRLLKTGWHADQCGHYWIDVKGKFSIYNDERYFSVIQKWLFDRHEIYCNKVIPQDFFHKTFIPKKVALQLNGQRRSVYKDCKMVAEILDTQQDLF